MFQKIRSYLNKNVEKISKIDVITAIFIMLIYALISFNRLGDTKSVETIYEAKKNEEIIFEFSENEDIIRLKFFIGENVGKLQIQSSNDGNTYETIKELDPFWTFAWNDERIAEKTKYLKIIAPKNISLGEIAFYNNRKEYIKPESITVNNKNIITLTDEQELIPEKVSYMNSSYFDEYYFARAAYEYANNMPSNEWTHPPLGKVIQAIPIYLTGKMTPFNYRLMGNISGILLVGIMYIFAIILFKKRCYAITSSLIMALDTFHFAQTRMGTVDSHLVLFITLSIMFMYLFIKKDKTRYLVLSGIFFALSISVKWTGFYAGLALAIIYFIHLIKNKLLNKEFILKGFSFFVAIPLIIYITIYLLFPNNYHKTNTLTNIFREQVTMYEFHSGNNLSHDFSSKWYTWPISYKPVWLYFSETEPTKSETISGIGNLVIWLTGIISFIYMFLKLVIKKDKEILYLLIPILSLYLPYVFIKRPMFLYHYFPVLPFLFLGIVYFLRDLSEKYKIKILIPFFLVMSFLFFTIYYPIVSGKELENEKIRKLELFDTWEFIN